MSDIQDYYESKFLEKQEEISSLKEKVKSFEQENAHLRKVNGIKLKKTTIKQSLVYANDALEKEREKVKELETVIGAWHNIFGTTQLSHAKSRLDAAEETVKRQEAEIAVVRAGLEWARKRIDWQGVKRETFDSLKWEDTPLMKALSYSPSEFLEAVKEATDVIEGMLEPMPHLLHKVIGENASYDILERMYKLQEGLSKLRRFV